MNFNNISGYLAALWLMIAVILFIPPTNPPGAAPVRVADVAPYHYSAPLSYAERFSPAAVGPPISSYFRGHCEVSRSAVTEQGVGE